MRGLTVLLVVSLVGFAPASFGDFNRTTGLIDIPTAERLETNVVRVMTNTTFALGDDEYPVYLDFGVGYGLLGQGEVALNAYTSKDYSIHLAWKLRNEEGWVPALGVGVQELTYRKWVSSVGQGVTTGFPDDVSYLKNGGRPSERFSAYVVATKDFYPLGSYTLGVGRGRFVGYGPRSHWFNTDNLFRADYRDTTDPISDLALGLFMGARWELYPGLFLMLEYDGRDANTGVRFESKYFDLSFALTHLEQITGSPRLNPRVAVGLSGNNSWLYELPDEGTLWGRVVDAETNIPLSARISFPGTAITSVETTGEGQFSVELPAGAYVVRASKDGYYWKQAKVTVSPGKRVRCSFTLRAKPSPEELERSRLIEEHLNRGKAHLAEGELLDAASEWEAALSLDPDCAEARSMLSRVRRLIELEVGAHRTKALGHASRGELSKAISEWEVVLNLDPGNREATSQIRELKAKLAAPKRPPPKRPPVKPPKPKVSPEEIAKIFNRGVSLFLAEEYEDALKAFKEVLDLDPKHEEARKYKEKTEARLKVLRGE